MGIPLSMISMIVSMVMMMMVMMMMSMMGRVMIMAMVQRNTAPMRRRSSIVDVEVIFFLSFFLGTFYFMLFAQHKSIQRQHGCSVLGVSKRLRLLEPNRILCVFVYLQFIVKYK